MREIERAGREVSFERVACAPDLTAALGRGPWDAVIAEHTLSDFDAQGALAIVRDAGLDLPFIVVSGTMTEETAVAALRAGAHDFVLKSNLARLVPALERELREAHNRAQKRHLQEHLVAVDRMVSVGLLAGGVAHEINNPLAAVIAQLDMAHEIADELDRDDPRVRDLGECIADAASAADRVREIVRDVKIFSRPDDGEVGAVDVHRVLDSVLRMAWNDIRHRARIVKRYGSVPSVRGSESRVGQVFLNLVMTAAQAMDHGRASQNELRVTTGLDGQQRVVIEIADTGAGMTAEDLGRLTSPMFAPGRVGTATALRLAICRDIVSDLGGEMAVASASGKGSTFRVVLLVRKERAARSSGAVADPMPSGGRKGKILVVEDEELVRSALRRLLGHQHEVVVAVGAEDALKRIRLGERFDLVLCDLMMPEMTGMDLHAEITRAAPDQADRIVFMSGGPLGSEASRFVEEGGFRLLEKPFRRAEVVSLVNEWTR